MLRKTASLVAAAALLAGCGARAQIAPTAPAGTAPAAYTAQSVYTPTIEGGRRPFMWGVSTAGYQWEGGNIAAQWFLFEMAGKTPERAGKAANGLNQYGEDAQLARGMGLNAFRTSIEWSRIEPAKGRIDPAGVAFYHKLFQTLRANGLTPVVTLMHFSYPQWLEDMGGWESGQSVDEFARYAEFVSKEYGGEVDWWLTFNEPTVYLAGGYLAGMMPPGKKNPIAAIKAATNFIASHKKAYDAIHRNDPVANVSFNNYAASYVIGNPNAAAPRTTQALDVNGDWMMNAMRGPRANGEGVRGRGYLDYIGVDYYCRWTLGLGAKFKMAWDWEIYPEGMYNTVKNYHRWFGLPVLVAENGMATEDLKPRKDGWTREAYMVAHVKQMKRAMSEGVPVLGYIHWSITDNWEWGSYSPRFGLYVVDCRNRDFRRVPTAGVDLYRQIVTNNGTTPALEARFPAPTRG
ncbi:MAG: glycoside hydrolase family 1 protein [Candidatus Sericytochromatia bacterium]|nr:glycoside hydrolase family 1 protein [Candidatus Tanganyikabacteria bacterium]